MITVCDLAEERYRTRRPARVHIALRETQLTMSCIMKSSMIQARQRTMKLQK